MPRNCRSKLLLFPSCGFFQKASSASAENVRKIIGMRLNIADKASQTFSSLNSETKLKETTLKGSLAYNSAMSVSRRRRRLLSSQSAPVMRMSFNSCRYFGTAFIVLWKSK